MVEESFPNQTVVIDGLSIARFIAGVSLMSVFVTNDTGPLHLAAGAGASIVLLLDARAPMTYLPITERLTRCQYTLAIIQKRAITTASAA